jgi:4-hydroxy 2-oxovalerate aldolase
MKNQIELLDCTLRDGGYINDWNFGYKTICAIMHKLIEAKTDYIETGFLRNCVYNKDVALYNTIEELKPILPTDKGGSKYSVMALHDLYDVKKLEPNDGIIDIIRVTFHNYDIDEGLTFIQKVMDKGYNVFCNPINIMGYSDVELLTLLEKINRLHPCGFSIVDTFGSMMKDDLLRIYLLVEHNIDQTIKIGLHLHENLGLSYSLAQNFIDICATNRHVVIDASLFGMGRVPGNLNIELMMDYMNKYQNGHYNPNAAYDAIDNYIERLKSIEPWGYSTAYALSAKYNLHRNYSEYLLKKGKLRTKDINHLLASIDECKKAAYDKNYIEALYIQYQNDVVNDSDTKKDLQKSLQNKKILVLAPGNSLNTYEECIRQFIEENDPVIISANYDDLPFGAMYNFYTNIKRFDQFLANESKKTILITSNVCKIARDTCIAFNYYDLACEQDGLYDNCVIMLLRLLNTIGINEVTIAGFDGFNDLSTNYADNTYNTVFHKEDTVKQNKIIKKHVADIQKKMNLHFITPSYYTTE